MNEQSQQPSQETDRASIWPASAQIALAILILLAITLVYLHSFRSRESRPAPPENEVLLAGPIDLNRASRSHLVLLPQVGPALAENIEKHRRNHGFQSVDDLLRVRGIGERKLRQIRPWVYVEKPIRKPPTIRSQSPTQKQPPGMLIDVNTATIGELKSLPRIGPVLSQRIVEFRKLSPFKRVEDLLMVRGIGPKTLAKIRPFVIVRSSDP